MSMAGNADLAVIRTILNRLRRRFALYEAARDLVYLVLVAGTLAFAGLWLDMYVHLAAPWRWAVLAGLAALAAALALRLVVVTLVRPTGDRWLAARVERRHPELKNRLITSLQIEQDGVGPEEFDREFAARVLRETAGQLLQLNWSGTIAWRRLRLPAAAALCAVLSLALLQTSWPEGFRAACARLLHPGRAIAAPARTKVTVDPAGAVVARGDSLRLTARVSGRLVREASLHIRRPGRNWTVISMLPRAATNGAPDSFTYELTELSYPLDYVVRAGDGETDMHRIAIVERPRIRKLALRYEFPEYLGLPPKDSEEGRSSVEAPVGTRVSLRVETDSEIAGGEIRLALQGEASPRSVPLKLGGPTDAAASFVLEKSGVYTPVVTNAAGLGEKSPPEYPLIAQADMPPIVEVIEPGRDLTLDDPQSIPVVATVRDDFGLRSVYVSIVVSNAPVPGTNVAGTAQPPGLRIVDVAEPGVRVRNATHQIECTNLPGFAAMGCASYTLYAVDRKGQCGQSRTFSVRLTPAARHRVDEIVQAATNIAADMPSAKPDEKKRPLPPELAAFARLVEAQRKAIELAKRAEGETARWRPDWNRVPADLQAAFDQQKQAARQMAETRNWADAKLAELAKNPNVQHPAFERSLRTTRDMMESLRNQEASDALDALRKAYLDVAPEGSNALARSAAPASPASATQPSPSQPQTQPQQAGRQQAGQPPQAAQPQPAAPAQPPGPQQAPDQPPQAGQQQPAAKPAPPGQAQPQPPAAPQAQSPAPASAPPESPAAKAPPAARQEDLKRNVENALRHEQQAMAKMEELQKRLEASLPGQVNETALTAMDQETRDKVAEMAEKFEAGLQLAAERLKEAEERIQPLAKRQEELRQRTMETQSEQVKNLAKSEDRLALDTGHAEERLEKDTPWLAPPEAPPQDLPQEQTASTAPRVPVPPTPPAPRKEVMDGPQPDMPPVSQPPGENPQPKLLVPDRFPGTFRGKMSDKPIPPPVNATPTSRAPSTSLRKMTDEEKEKLRNELMLDSLEIDDSVNAFALGAPAHEEMPEEMLLEPGAQYNRGPAAPDSKPGMELGQSAGKIMGNPQQPPAGGGGGSPTEQSGGKPPPPSPGSGQQSPPRQSPPSSSPSSGQPPAPPSGQPPSGQPPPGATPGSQPGQQAAGSQGGSASGQPQPGAPQGPLGPAVAEMQQAAESLRQSDREAAVTAQAASIAALEDRQRQIAELRGMLQELGARFADVARQMGAKETTQAEMLNTLERAINSPAWNADAMGALSDGSQVQLDALRSAARGAYGALGGMAALEAAAAGPTNIVEWARFKLPPHLRQELLDGLREKGPAAYQQILEEYYRSIAREK